MKGAKLERAVAAPLQATGWFLLRGPKDETFQAFELDVLGYRFDGGAEESLVIESKGGKSGFSDLWKLLGLKTHLRIDQGVLLADEDDPLHGRKVTLGRANDIAVIDRDAADLTANLAEIGLVEDAPSRAVLSAWERSYRVEDGLVATIFDKGLWTKHDTIKLAKRQLQHLVTKGWLERDPWRQALRLYARYQEEPKIALRMAAEIDPGNAHWAFDAALKRGEHPEIQACFYLEHRKRIAVAFAATRCAIYGDESRWHDWTPWSFREMVERIRDEEAWYLPAVMQTYFLGFGGMICLDAEDEEFGHLAHQAGCTPVEARRALQLFGDLFPYPGPGGWYYEAFELSRLKLMPDPLRGAGLRMREALYNGKWLDLATDLQRQVAGMQTLKRAAELEARVA